MEKISFKTNRLNDEFTMDDTGCRLNFLDNVASFQQLNVDPVKSA